MCLIRTVIWSQMQPKREAEESKESMTRHHENLRVELVEWGQEEAALRAIREIVFIREQSVPEKLECDGLDPSCAHVLAWNGHGEAIGTARMQKNGTLGRMAVLKDWRGRGVG